MSWRGALGRHSLLAPCISTAAATGCLSTTRSTPTAAAVFRARAAVTLGLALVSGGDWGMAACLAWFEANQPPCGDIGRGLSGSVGCTPRQTACSTPVPPLALQVGALSPLQAAANMLGQFVGGEASLDTYCILPAVLPCAHPALPWRAAVMPCHAH